MEALGGGLCVMSEVPLYSNSIPLERAEAHKLKNHAFCQEACRRFRSRF